MNSGSRTGRGSSSLAGYLNRHPVSTPLIAKAGCIHARYEETFEPRTGKYYGGVDRLSYMVKKAREQREAGEGPAVLYVDSGDIFSGSIWFFVHSYRGAAKIFNEIQPDAVNVGVHEFDAKMEGLTKFSELINFPIISTNINFHNETELEKKIKPAIIKVIDGVKVAILGYIIPEWILYAEKGGIEFLDVIPLLNKECRRLRFEEDVKVIIALSQGTIDTDRLIAHGVDYINVIIGTGSAAFLWNGVPPDLETPVDSYPVKVTRRDGSLVLIVHAYQYLKYMGKLQVRFTKDGKIRAFFGTPILMDSSISQDPKMTKLIEELRHDVISYDQKVLTTCSVLLEGSSCNHQECNFGNLVMDAIVEYRASQYQGPGWTDAAVALMNSGSITTDINSPQHEDQIFYGDIIRALPYSEMLYMVEIKGSDLLFILEISTVGLEPTNTAQFLLTAGLKVMFDFNSRFGKRVKLIKVRCAECDVPEYFPLDLKKRYKVIITNYLLRGRSGYTIIRDVVWNPISIGERDTNVIIKYLEKVKYVIPEVGGRLIPYDKRFNGNRQHSFGSRFNFDCYCFLLMLSSFVTLITK
ncbi:protein 5NUC-like isoform X2 [Onthophagus taurus]|uniref:protein 5NUC-like isoform X2 n=1 Tax=Onthophagus taurus TaxID=166361 RepID=UPI0039BE980D